MVFQKRLTHLFVWVTCDSLLRERMFLRNWCLWTSTNFASNEWNNLDKSLSELALKSFEKFKKATRNVTI